MHQIFYVLWLWVQVFNTSCNFCYCWLFLQNAFESKSSFVSQTHEAHEEAVQNVPKGSAFQLKMVFSETENILWNKSHLNVVM